VVRALVSVASLLGLRFEFLWMQTSVGPCLLAKLESYPICLKGVFVWVWGLANRSGYTKWLYLGMVPHNKKKKKKRLIHIILKIQLKCNYCGRIVICFLFLVRLNMNLKS
jgi:hypothetical protein